MKCLLRPFPVACLVAALVSLGLVGVFCDPEVEPQRPLTAATSVVPPGAANRAAIDLVASDPGPEPKPAEEATVEIAPPGVGKGTGELERTLTSVPADGGAAKAAPPSVPSDPSLDGVPVEEPTVETGERPASSAELKQMERELKALLRRNKQERKIARARRRYRIESDTPAERGLEDLIGGGEDLFDRWAESSTEPTSRGR